MFQECIKNFKNNSNIHDMIKNKDNFIGQYLYELFTQCIYQIAYPIFLIIIPHVTNY